MNASLSKAVYLFAAPLSQMARVIEALRAKVEAESPGVTAEAPPESTDTATQDAPVVQDAVAASADSPEEIIKDVATGGDES